MSNIVSIEITETSTWAVEIDLDKYVAEVLNKYNEKDACYFSDWKGDAKVVTTDYEWG